MINTICKQVDANAPKYDFKLKNINSVNSQIRALSYQLYEINGVVKRDDVLNIVNNLSQDERKTLRNFR